MKLGDQPAAGLAAETVTIPQQGVESIPFELRAINAEQVGALLGLAPRTVLETVACRPDFPVRLTMRPATWIAGEVLEWRQGNRAGAPRRRPDLPSHRQQRIKNKKAERGAAEDAAADFCRLPARQSE